MKKTVCLIGRPNVGKSTIFNRLIRENKSIIMDDPGVTRDRIYGTCEYRNYKFHLTIFCDTLAHFLLSLFGIYLIKTKQIELTKKMVTISSLFIVVVAIIMLILNLIFKTSFFGLNLYGNHNIYNMVLVKNKYLSTLIYFVGLNLVLIIGYFYQKIFFVQKRS